MQDYLDDHTQPNYALSINTVLGRQKISGRGSRRTMKKGQREKKNFQRELLMEPSPISALYFSLSVLLYLSTFGMICL